MSFPPHAGYTRVLYESTPLSHLLVPTARPEVDHHYTRAQFDLSGHWEMAALWVATHMVCLRTGGSSVYFDQWLDQLEGTSTATSGLRTVLAAYLSDDIGSPSSPPNGDHFHGFLVEHVWHALTRESQGVAGQVVRVEPPSWSATDPGGDGLAIYRNSAGKLEFRLWESKWHGSANSARPTANRAADQVAKNATRYLARLSKAGAHLPDEEVRELYERLAELWVHQDSRAGAGVAIAAQPSADKGKTFGGLASRWRTLGPKQREGLLAIVESLDDFADTTQRYLWKGL